MTILYYNHNTIRHIRSNILHLTIHIRKKLLNITLWVQTIFTKQNIRLYD